jgi:hypothetical protein
MPVDCGERNTSRARRRTRHHRYVYKKSYGLNMRVLATALFATALISCAVSAQVEAEGISHGCADLTTLRSGAGGQSVNVQFNNFRNETISIVWIDGQGVGRPLASLGYRQSNTFTTSTADAWSIVDQHSNCLGAFIVSKNRTIQISETEIVFYGSTVICHGEDSSVCAKHRHQVYETCDLDTTQKSTCRRYCSSILDRPRGGCQIAKISEESGGRCGYAWSVVYCSH